MDHKVAFDLTELPGGEWLRLEEAMNFVLSTSDGDWDAGVAAPQLALHEAARDRALVLRGIPKLFDEAEFEEDAAARQPIPSTYFMIEGVRGFDYEDGSILPFSFEAEADAEDAYDRLIRRRTRPVEGAADEWRFVIVEREGFVRFLRDYLRRATAEQVLTARRVALPAASDIELVEMVRKTNQWLGGTATHPVSVDDLLREINAALEGQRAVVKREAVRDALPQLFPDKVGAGRLTASEKEARDLRRKNCAEKISLAKLLL